MDSCPVCYEAFSSDSDGSIPRKLPCEHVVCTQCATESWEEDDEGTGVRCPECFELFRFDSLEAVPMYDCSAEGGDTQDTQDTPESVEDTPESAQTENGNGDGNGNVPKSSSHQKRNNKLTAFLSTQKEDSVEDFDHSGEDDDSVEEVDDAGGVRVCKTAGCAKQVFGNAPVCPEHTKRLSVVSVSAMVHKFKDTKLSSVALKSDKVEVKRGSVAGDKGKRFDPDEIADRFKRQERLELGEAVELIEAVKNILREYNNMVELEAPVLVVGDVHGQYFDLLKILQMWRPDTRLLFLGDYVDRGQFSCEVILHLFALKLRYPDKVHLIRGNHECSSVSAHFGFKDECKAKYGLTVYYRFLLAFQTMPICALISTKRGRIFACHGGISPDVTSLSDIENIDRFAEPEMDGPLCDMLWADPMNEDDNDKLTEEEYKEFLDTDYIANQVRGCSYMFGYHAVERFLRENRLMYMVRAHEVQEHGFRSHFSSPEWALAAAEVAAREDDFTDEDSEIDSDGDGDGSSNYDKVLADTSRHLSPTVLTVFSAPNYCDRYQNKAAVLYIDEGGFYIVNLLHAEPHPDPVQETDMNVMQLLAMGKTCPYMPTSFREFLKVAVQLGRAVKPSSANHSLAADDIVATATAAMVAADAAADEAAVAALAPHASDDEGSGDKKSDVVFTPVTDSEDDSGERIPICPPVRPVDGSRKDLRGFSNPVLAASAGWRKSSLSSVSSSVLLEDAGGRGEGGEEAPRKRLVESEEKAEVPNARKSFLGTMSLLSKRGMRGLGLLDAMSLNQSAGVLTRQNAWAIRGDSSSTPTEARSKQFHKAHARDGINEMHPEVLDRRISAQESEASGRRSTGFTAPSLEGLLFGPGGLKRQASVTHPTTQPSVTKGEEDEANGDGGHVDGDEDPCPAPSSRGIRRQCTLKMSLVTSRRSSERMRESKSRDELAAMMSSKSIADLAQMDKDVELEFEGCGSDSAAASESEFGATCSLDNGGTSMSRCSSFDREMQHGMVTPSPRSRKSSLGEYSPSQMLFTHEEIVVLKLLFSLFDRKSKNFITRDDIIAYAEEGGDYAQLKEVDACMEAIDADMDGKVGLSDYINFAARLKEIHSLQQTQEASVSDIDEGRIPSQEAGEE